MLIKMKGLLIQWGTVVNTSGSTNFFTQNLIAYSNAEYKIFLQGRYSKQAEAYPIVNTTNITSHSFQYFWAENTNYLNYCTIGY